MANIFGGLGQGLGALGAGIGRGELAGTQFEFKARQQKALQDYKNSLLELQGQKEKDATQRAQDRIDQQQRQMFGRRAQQIDRVLNDPLQVANLNKFPGMLERLKRDREDSMAAATGQLDWRQVQPSQLTDPITGEVRLPPGAEGPFAGAKPGPWAPGMASGMPWQPGADQRPSDNPYLPEKDRQGAVRTETGQASQADTAGYHASEVDLGNRRLGLDISKENRARVQADFDNGLKLAEAQLRQGNQTFEQQFQTWRTLIGQAGELARQGGDPAKALRPFLFSKGFMGMQVPNEAVIRQFLQMEGFGPDVADKVIQGNPLSGAGRETLTNPTGEPVAAVRGSIQSGAPPRLPPSPATPGAPGSPTLAGATAFTTDEGFQPGSGTGGQHNPGSLHYQGRALDVHIQGKTPAEIQRFMSDAKAQGYIVRDERTHPKGQGVWTGPHIHLEWGPQTRPNAAAAIGIPEPAPGQEPQPGPGGALPVDFNAAAARMGVKTPATAPRVKSPYPANSNEDRIFALITGRNGRATPVEDLMRSFQNNPKMQAIVQAVNDRANTQQREGRFSGAPVAGTNDAMWPGLPQFGANQLPGGLQTPVPQGTPVVNQGGFAGNFNPAGGGPAPPQASPQPPPDMGQPGPVNGPPRPPLVITPEAYGRAAARGVFPENPADYRPEAPPPPPDQSISSVPYGDRQMGPNQNIGPVPKSERGYNWGTGDTRLSRIMEALMGSGPTSGMVSRIPGAAGETGALPPPPTQRSAPGLTTGNDPSVMPELNQLRGMPWAPAVEKFLGANKITDPAQQRDYHRWVTQQLVPRMMNLPKMTQAQVLSMVFPILQKYARPQ